ncbi:hypothetical protein CEXT_603541 [Caerostris extrusa]|uniref:Uncharacterized protein n=1 Tax=Caerostris extrusa TaxID=172846 RepID=A0AAV4PYJ4_CAEEX|nr:hypothetical protein CEXT_603541 [Caerostris extrusa]
MTGVMRAINPWTMSQCASDCMGMQWGGTVLTPPPSPPAQPHSIFSLLREGFKGIINFHGEGRQETSSIRIRCVPYHKEV